MFLLIQSAMVSHDERRLAKLCPLVVSKLSIVSKSLNVAAFTISKGPLCGCTSLFASKFITVEGD